MQIKNDDKTILPKICNELSKKTRKRLPLLSGIEKNRLLEATRKYYRTK